jgi:hypothetical protein
MRRGDMHVWCLTVSPQTSVEFEAGRCVDSETIRGLRDISNRPNQRSLGECSGVAKSSNRGRLPKRHTIGVIVIGRSVRRHKASGTARL